MTDKFYISFGQTHTHSHNGKTLDKDCIGVINAESYTKARELAFEWFGQKWCFIYQGQPDMSFFPRGLIELN